MMVQELLRLSEKVSIYRKSVLSEEATKMAFILPMISFLGYDIFNPLEVIPEMECDISKRSDRIDYAICKDNNPIILVECKMAGVNLGGYVHQLAKYFVASKAKFAILTNGIEYRFFSDLRDKNLMDEVPFFTLNLLQLNENDFLFMTKFSKESFDETKLYQSARIMSHRQDVTLAVKDILSNPSSDFVRMLVAKFYDGIITNSVVEEFTPLVREAVSQYTGYDIEEQDVSLPEDDILPSVAEAFDIIKSIILDMDASQKVVYKVFKSNVRIAILNKWHYICKLDFTDRRKRIGFPVGDYTHIEWVDIQSTKDIYSLTEYIHNALIVAKNHLAQYV